MSSKKRFVATESSLSLSETIANALGDSFDKEKTRKQARVLHDLYFKDISKVLPDEAGNCHFENFASRDFVLFAYPTKTAPSIEMDQQWPMFLFDANFLICVRTCIVLNESEKHQSAILFKETLHTISNPHSYETLREKMKPWFLEHVKVLPLVNLLTNCMFGFMICHELAHHNLGHFDKEQNKRQELEADTKGYEYLRQVSFEFENLEYLKIPPNYLSAPILGMNYLHALESVGIISPAGDTHPSVSERTQNLRQQFNAIADEDALYLDNGLQLGFEELMNEMKESE